MEIINRNHVVSGTGEDWKIAINFMGISTCEDRKDRVVNDPFQTATNGL